MNETLKAELVEVFDFQIKRSVRYTFKTLLNAYGSGMKGVYNSRLARVWAETIRPCCESTSNIPSQNEYFLSETRLDRFANSCAQEMADEVLAKVDSKVGELTDAIVHRVGGANFQIAGIKGDRKVFIEQTQILNVSSKGKLFNQFPSRIYVDGKFTSAANFAKI